MNGYHAFLSDFSKATGKGLQFQEGAHAWSCLPDEQKAFYTQKASEARGKNDQPRLEKRLRKLIDDFKDIQVDVAVIMVQRDTCELQMIGKGPAFSTLKNCKLFQSKLLRDYGVFSTKKDIHGLRSDVREKLNRLSKKAFYGNQFPYQRHRNGELSVAGWPPAVPKVGLNSLSRKCLEALIDAEMRILPGQMWPNHVARPSAAESAAELAQSADQLAVESHNQLDVESDNQLAVESDNQLDVESDNQLDVESDNQLAVESDNQLAVESHNQLAVESDNQLAVESDNQLAVESDDQLAAGLTDQLACAPMTPGEVTVLADMFNVNSGSLVLQKVEDPDDMEVTVPPPETRPTLDVMKQDMIAPSKRKARNPLSKAQKGLLTSSFKTMPHQQQLLEDFITQHEEFRGREWKQCYNFLYKYLKNK